jgi:beta-glucosidase
VTLGQWQTQSINLNCFEKVKMDMLLSPFTLTTAGELDLTLHHLRIEPQTTSAINCQ